jgi:hypothetical protein
LHQISPGQREVADRTRGIRKCRGKEINPFPIIGYNEVVCRFLPALTAAASFAA